MADDPHETSEASEARSVFFTDLNELQAKYQADETLETAWNKAVAKGFAFQSWVDRDGPVYFMAHYQGHVLTVRPSTEVYESASQVLAGLLGLPSSLGIEALSDAQASPAVTPPAAPATSAASAASAAPEPEPEPEPEPALAPPPAAPPAPPAAPPVPPAAPPVPPAASEPEAFDLEEDRLEATPADPDPEADPSTSTEPLSDEDKQSLLAMLRALPPAQSKAAIVAFRKAFSVPPGVTKPGDAITEVRHRVFLTRLIDEAEGITAP